MEVRERPKELNVSGPVMRRPEDVRRLYTQYEEMVTPFMKSINGTVGRAAVVLLADRAAAAVKAAVAAPARPPCTYVSVRQGAEEHIQGRQKLSGNRTDELLIRSFRRRLGVRRPRAARALGVQPGPIARGWKRRGALKLCELKEYFFGWSES